MFCTNCGSQISSDGLVCPACGQSLAAFASATAPAAAWTPPVGVQSQTGRWIGEGWRMVKADMGTYVLLAFVFMVLNGTVPFILQGPLLAGFHIFCMKKTLNRPAELADLFKGFNYFVPTLVASLLISLFVFGGTLLCIIPGLVLAAMYKFTYLFIVDKRMDFWPAMQASHAVVKNDYFGFTIFLLAVAGVNLLGLLCCIVGLLVTMPVTFAAITVAYKEIIGFEPTTVEII
ncbi:MAG: hypothetical protein DMG57_20595 [Acidobacteria bacterium]|nr:MAG: hypothetical protein DMG57_20595 [Acidobacteriota bacterium]